LPKGIYFGNFLYIVIRQITYRYFGDFCFVLLNEMIFAYIWNKLGLWQ